MEGVDLSQIEVLDFTTGNDATGAVIFLHGVGDTGRKTRDCIEEIMEGPLDGMIGPSHIKMYFPTAPEAYVSVRDRVLTSWFDGARIGRDLHEVDVDYDDCNKAGAFVIHLIEQIEASGIPRNRIVLAGISQGGMLAQYVAYTQVRGIAGVLVMATTFPFPRAEVLKPPHPVLYQMHGLKDFIIPIKGVRMAENFLKSFGVETNLLLFRRSDHTIDEHYMKTFFQLLKQIIPA